MQQSGDMRACLGRIDVWQANESQEVQDFFAALMQSLDMFEWVQVPDGNLRVRIHGGVMAYRKGTDGWTNV